MTRNACGINAARFEKYAFLDSRPFGRIDSIVTRSVQDADRKVELRLHAYVAHM